MVSVIIWIHLGVCGFLQITGETVGEVMAVADMHQRKAEMAKHSDAFIALPGSYNMVPPIFPLKKSRIIRHQFNIMHYLIYINLAHKIKITSFK